MSVAPALTVVCSPTHSYMLSLMHSHLGSHSLCHVLPTLCVSVYVPFFLCCTLSGGHAPSPSPCQLLCMWSHALHFSHQVGLGFSFSRAHPSGHVFAVASFPSFSRLWSCALCLSHAVFLAVTCSLSVMSSSSLCLCHGHALFLSLEHSLLLLVLVYLPVTLSLGLCHMHWLILSHVHCVVLSGSCSCTVLCTLACVCSASHCIVSLCSTLPGTCT